MSDGISEGYRATRAMERFEEAWSRAKAEHILLGAKEKLGEPSNNALLDRLLDLSGRVEVRSYHRFKSHMYGKTYYLESAPSHEKTEMVMRYSIEVSGNGVHKRFEGESISSVMKDAILYVEWSFTEEGKKAVEDYSDY